MVFLTIVNAKRFKGEHVDLWVKSLEIQRKIFIIASDEINIKTKFVSLAFIITAAALQ